MTGADNEAVLIVDPSGKLAFRCRHSHGESLGWKDYRAFYEKQSNAAEDQRIDEGYAAHKAAQADRTDKEAEADVDPEQLREKELAEYRKNSTASYIQDFLNGISESVNTPPTATGFHVLDELLDGGFYEGLYTVGAITSLGKTTIMLQIMDQIAMSGHDVLVFSLEMSRTELMSKSISRITMLDCVKGKLDKSNAKTSRGITAGARYAHYSPTELDTIEKAVREYAAFADHIYIRQGTGDFGVDQIIADVKRHISITGTRPIVLIDYLQILAPEDIRASDKQNTDKAVVELKRLSRDYKIPVIAVSSFNRMNYNTKVTSEAFKESGAIEYTSDVLIGLQFEGAGESGFDAEEAKKANPRPVELVILKNRFGATGRKIKYEYYPMFNYFMEMWEVK